jgi:hypothetical protein
MVKRDKTASWFTERSITETARRASTNDKNGGGMKRKILSMATKMTLRSDREDLEDKVGRVWDTDELQVDFEVKGFAAPYVVVTQKSTGRTGSLLFQNNPRLYFAFEVA